MAVSQPSHKKRGQPTYPVWVGNLHQDVKDKELRATFSGYGKIATCVIMKDEHGRSKHFGYVNYLKEERAECAARKMAGYVLHGLPIQTKGPTKLVSEGHLKRQFDYRPLTDCAFFAEGSECKYGKRVS